MSSDKKDKNKQEEDSHEHKCDGCHININIHYTFNIGNKEFHVEQRAEGGGQINKNVGTNANQGGQNAIDHSASSNDHSNFADGNGRSGIAGNDNDEAGGQQGIKVRDSVVKKSIIASGSEHNESGDVQPDEADEMEAMDEENE
ncbi:hypothetical protein ABES02_26945 [Neobacillus pocheonensis]|uniref:hypothetical protein n=1 Tax=Neobacillus pocheonensis TaxID=363869 RepID=UPI003D291BD9